LVRSHSERQNWREPEQCKSDGVRLHKTPDQRPHLVTASRKYEQANANLGQYFVMFFVMIDVVTTAQVKCFQQNENAFKAIHKLDTPAKVNKH